MRVQADFSQAVKTIRFAAQNDDFRITGYVPYIFGAQRGSAGRDLTWERLIEDDLVGVCCIHLGGKEDVPWIIEMYEDYRKKASENVIPMRANRGDLYVPQISALSRFSFHPDSSAILHFKGGLQCCQQ